MNLKHSKDGTLEHDGIKRYAIALGPQLQNHEIVIGDKPHAELKETNWGNIVEWYTLKCDGEYNKSLGLKQYDMNSQIIIYRNEVIW